MTAPVQTQPRPVNALQFTSETAPDLAAWCAGTLVDGNVASAPYLFFPAPGHGSIYVPLGSWVIQDALGRFRCVPDEDFQALYQPTES